MSCPYIQKEDHRVWQPRTREESDEAFILAGPNDPIWDWAGWREVPEEGEEWKS